jgi:hypothetical protein
MGPASVREYIRAISKRYATTTAAAKRHMLDEFCATTGYHRKSAIRALGRPPRPTSSSHHRGRPQAYREQVVGVLAAIWEAAGYPWSSRLKALLPLWLPWAKHRFAIPPAVEQQLLTISRGTIDRRLQSRKRQLKRRLYGRTKPGTLLKHQIPIKTERWETTAPGFVEVDLVSHSGNSADGEFLQSLNVTDIHTTWVETRAVLGKGQRVVRAALEEMQTAMPFALQGLDSDNGVEFINAHLFRYCQTQHIQFTRGRPYKKDDNAHIEQKNWTHVRKLLGYDRYDSLAALEAINDLYRNELRLMMNLFQPSVKLLRKVRVGSKLKRVYDAPQTPLDRLLASPQGDPEKIAALAELRSRLDPFVLATAIDRKLSDIYRLANHRQSPRPLSRVEREAISTLERVFEIPVVVGRPQPSSNPLPHR